MKATSKVTSVSVEGRRMTAPVRVHRFVMGPSSDMQIVEFLFEIKNTDFSRIARTVPHGVPR